MCSVRRGQTMLSSRAVVRNESLCHLTPVKSTVSAKAVLLSWIGQCLNAEAPGGKGGMYKPSGL